MLEIIINLTSWLRSSSSLFGVIAELFCWFVGFAEGFDQGSWRTRAIYLDFHSILVLQNQVLYSGNPTYIIVMSLD